MTSSPAVDIWTTGLREGTAQRANGKRTAAKIVEAAYQLLKTGGYENFSLRNVADRAGVHLGNLQYYYKKREDLVYAVVRYVERRYADRYSDIIALADDSPEGRLAAVIRFHCEDVRSADARRLFIQLWPLLSVSNEYHSDLLNRLHHAQIAQITARVQELNPTLPEPEARLRAELITAMLGGLIATAPSSRQPPKALNLLLDKTIRTALCIARNEV